MIPGNYEDEEVTKQSNFYQTITDKYEVEVKSSTLFVDFIKDDLYCHLAHLPSQMVPYNDKVFCLFGHIHRLRLAQKFIKDGILYVGWNVGVDGNHFRPYSIEDIKFQLNGILNHYDEEVFI